MSLSTEHLTIFGLLLAVFGFLLWGRVRYDLVAFAALVLALIVGAVPVEAAFSGFGHPATVIIALVLIVSRGLFNSGVVEAIARVCVAGVKGVGAHIGLMSGVGGLLSAVMNNVAALSLLMPVDIEAARKAGLNCCSDASDDDTLWQQLRSFKITAIVTVGPYERTIGAERSFYIDASAGTLVPGPRGTLLRRSRRDAKSLQRYLMTQTEMDA